VIPPRTSTSRRQGGFSLIELMVALVLGLVLIGGVINIFVTNQQAFRTNENLARLQENARISFELTAREMRQAGGNPCGATLVSNTLVDPAARWAYNWDGGSVRGFDGGQDATGIVATGPGVGERVAGTDAVTVLSGGLDNGVTIVSHNPTSATLFLSTVNHGIQENEIVMVCDAGSAAITQITNSSSGTNNTIVHNPGQGSNPPPNAPGNCTKGLGFPSVCTTNGTEKEMQGGGVVTRLSASFWYIGNNPRGGRSLYRQQSFAPAEEIAEGVVGLELKYLMRDTGSGNLGADWIDATAIADWSNAAPLQVVAVRMRATLQTQQNVSIDGQPLVRQLVHVVNIRNRSL
jgi:type IV pilus assembly protein PilW